MDKGITLALDTSEARGSIVLRRAGLLVSWRQHDTGQDYSSWLLPAAHDVMHESSCKLEDVTLLAAATGPGSFTGLRVGLTTVKAWAEVYGIPVVGISRLEALAHCAHKTSTHIAACYDAQRGEVFGGVFRQGSTGIEAVAPEAVLSPEALLELVSTTCGLNRVSWVTPDPALISSPAKWQGRLALGDTLISSTDKLANKIGELAEKLAGKQQFCDPVALDANYVRRSDAELFWKGNTKHVR